MLQAFGTTCFNRWPHKDRYWHAMVLPCFSLGSALSFTPVHSCWCCSDASLAVGAWRSQNIHCTWGLDWKWRSAGEGWMVRNLQDASGSKINQTRLCLKAHIFTAQQSCQHPVGLFALIIFSIWFYKPNDLQQWNLAVVTQLFTANCCPMMIETLLYEKPWMLSDSSSVSMSTLNKWTWIC